MGRAEIALDCRNLHGEGVFWNDRDGQLWWTDIHGKKLWWFEPKGGKSASIEMPDRVMLLRSPPKRRLRCGVRQISGLLRPR